MKNSLRKEKISARDSLTPAERDIKSRAICRRILSSGEYRNAETVMLYKYTKGEVQLTLIEEENAAALHPKRFLYPVCRKTVLKPEGLTGGAATVIPDMIAVEPADPDVTGSAWKKGSFGISEPDSEMGTVVSPEEIDLVICPCTAFDREGHRLGMGGGYYDRFLPNCRKAAVIAAAFENQRAESVPCDGWDQPVDRVYTELS